MKFGFTAVTFWLLLISFASPAYAVVIPSFPACTAPQGDVKANYSEGTHGIVGSTTTYTGSDTVYTLSGDTLVQCFCPKDGARGIQSNWWKATALSTDDIEMLKRDGWNYVPNGSLWGLENATYVVKNDEYTCGGGSSGIVQSAVAQATNVLGLAATGDIMLVIGTGVGGLALLLLGLYVYFSTRK